jgi:hypothetical protein
MFKCLLFLSVATLCCADTVTYTYTTTEGLEQNCNVGYYTCSALTLSIPQFNPDLGILQAIDWTFTDGLQFYSGYNDIADEYEPSVPFSYSTTEGDQSTILGLDVSATQQVSGYTCQGGCRNVSGGGTWGWIYLTASGTVQDFDPFVGDGTIAIDILPVVDATWPVSTEDVASSIGPIISGMTLEVTYVVSPVPEPRAIWMLGCIALVVGLLVKH